MCLPFTTSVHVTFPIFTTRVVYKRPPGLCPSESIRQMAPMCSAGSTPCGSAKVALQNVARDTGLWRARTRSCGRFCKGPGGDKKHTWEAPTGWRLFRRWLPSFWGGNWVNAGFFMTGNPEGWCLLMFEWGKLFESELIQAGLPRIPAECYEFLGAAGLFSAVP